VIRAFVLSSLCLLPAISASADVVPPRALHGRSVLIAWNETRMQRNVGQPNFYQIKTNHGIDAYVSVKGRFFNRFTINTSVGNFSNDQVAGIDGARRVPDFGERSLSMVLPFQTGGARKIEVEFDAAFGKCSAKVSYVKPSGATTDLVFSPVTKRIVEIQSMAPADERCSVREGNVFAD
jgi:hypothetical protein